MTKRRTLMATACFASLCGRALYGQTVEKGTTSFQYFMTNDIMPGSVTLRMEGAGGRTVAGRPLSATEERRTVQVLGDGTRIDKLETDKFFRDDQGRTRIERNGGAEVVIADPVAGFSSELNTVSRSARKMMVMKTVSSTGQKVDEAGPAADKVKFELMAKRAELMARRPVAVSTTEGAVGNFAYAATYATTQDSKEPQLPNTAARTEDLGTLIVNGTAAQGTRSTITIAAGQIGNDREIRIVSERWYSPDLQMLVKSSNNDPRFGETTYQLNNLIQGAQDPALFQIPADFNVNGLR